MRGSGSGSAVPLLDEGSPGVDESGEAVTWEGERGPARGVVVDRRRAGLIVEKCVIAMEEGDGRCR